MLGPMSGVTIASVLVAPFNAPSLLRKILLPILGVMLGSGFKPDVLGHIGDWMTTIAILPFYVAAAFSASFFVYRKLGRFDPVTAYFSAAPGGLTDMMIIGAEAGGVERRIALAHASRILIVVSTVTAFYALVLGISATGNARPYTPFSAVPAPDLGLLLGCALVGAWAAPRLKLPAPQIIGPMILSGLVHITGLTEAPPPTLAVNAAQLVIGTVVGCRFVGVPAREVLRDLGLASVASFAMLVVAFASAWTVTLVTGIGHRQTVLTFSPGGLPEMSLLSLAMQADVAYVATIHILRITLVIAVAPLVFSRLRLNRS
jgi:membrane AbrB-like protein